MGFLEELEKFEFSSDDEHLFWLRIALVLFLKIRLLLGLGKKEENEGVRECETETIGMVG